MKSKLALLICTFISFVCDGQVSVKKILAMIDK
jgi:hypothetical protein